MRRTTPSGYRSRWFSTWFAVSALVALTPMSSGRAKKAWVVITSIIFDLAYL